MIEPVAQHEAKAPHKRSLFDALLSAWLLIVLIMYWLRLFKRLSSVCNEQSILQRYMRHEPNSQIGRLLGIVLSILITEAGAESNLDTYTGPINTMLVRALLAPNQTKYDELFNRLEIFITKLPTTTQGIKLHLADIMLRVSKQQKNQVLTISKQDIEGRIEELANFIVDSNTKKKLYVQDEEGWSDKPKVSGAGVDLALAIRTKIAQRSRSATSIYIPTATLLTFVDSSRAGATDEGCHNTATTTKLNKDGSPKNKLH